MLACSLLAALTTTCVVSGIAYLIPALHTQAGLTLTEAPLSAAEQHSWWLEPSSESALRRAGLRFQSPEQALAALATARLPRHASEFLGVRSLTISVYTTWVTRSDLAGASQIALAMLVLVVALMLAVGAMGSVMSSTGVVAIFVPLAVRGYRRQL